MQYPFIKEEINQPVLPQHTMVVNDYLLVLQPHEDLYNKIMTIKKSFANKYDCPTALYSKPHITLIRFMQYEMVEKKILPQLQNIIATAAPFSVAINGFKSFPTHTIYADVETKNSIVDLVKTLKPIQALLKFDTEHKPHFITEPHLTIARKLQPWQYEKGLLEYSNTPFTASFMASQILLLKRNVEAKGYTVVATFSLLNKQPAVTTQTSLFS